MVTSRLAINASLIFAVAFFSAFIPLVSLVFLCIMGSWLISKFLGYDLILSLALSFTISIVLTGFSTILIYPYVRGHVFQFINIFYLILSTFFYFLCLQSYKSNQSVFHKVHKTSYFAFGMFIVVLLLFLKIPLLDRSPEALVSLIASGEDNLSHISIYNYIYKYNSLAYGQTEGIWGGLANYPQTIHTFVAYIAASLDRVINLSPTNLLRIYYLFLSVSASLMAFFTYKIISISIVFRPRLNIILWSIISSIFIFTNILASMHVLGYTAQIVSIVSILALVCVLTIHGYNHDKTLNRAKYYLLLLLSSGVILSWYLAGIVLVPFLIHLIYRRAHKKDRMISVLVLGVSAIPGLLHIFMGQSHEAINSIAGNPLSIKPIGFYCLLVIPLAILSLKNNEYRKNPSIFLVFIGASMMPILFGLLLLVFNGSLNYFFYKISIIAYVISFLYGAFLLSVNTKLKESTISLLIMVLLLTNNFITIIDDVKKYVLQYARSYAYITQLSKDEVRDLLPAFSINSDFSDAIYINNCEKVKQYFGNRYIGSILLTQSEERRNLEVESLKSGIGQEVINTYMGTSSKSQKLLTVRSSSCDM